MLEQELKNIWKNSSKTAQISIETNQLINEFDTKITRIQKKIRNRDVREISASVFGIIIFSFLLRMKSPFQLRNSLVFYLSYGLYLLFINSGNRNYKTLPKN